MDLKLSSAELELRDGLRAWLDANYDFDAHLARTGVNLARDERLWQGLVAQGWIARALPRHGALEQSVIDASIIAEEFGRALVVEPFFRSAFLAANILFEALPAAEAHALIERIGSGADRFACALYEPEGRFRLDTVMTRAVEDGDGWRLSGRKAVVFDGADADRLLVTARTGAGEVGLFLVAGDTAGVDRTRFHTIDDLTAADIVLNDAEAHLLASSGAVPGAIAAGVDRAIVALGAEAVGAGQAAIDETAAYAGRREQFGRPIAQFQVISHRLARMFIELEALRGGVLEALSVATADAHVRAQAAAGLKLLVGENGRFVVNQGIQVHGGVGTINEFKVSHCFKRVFALETLYGNGDYHLARYADAMG